jgi:hypothetical protein
MTTAVISDYLEAKILNHVLRNTAYTSPGTSVYVSLHTANPTDVGNGAEVSGGSYARVQVTAWNAPSSRATANTNGITFPTATGSWGTVTHVGIWDAASAGNLLFYGALNVSKTVTSGVTFSIAAGDLDIALDGEFSTYLSHALLNHILRNTAYTSPGTSVYVSLHTATLTAAMTETEVGGNNYARVQVTAWDAPSATGGDTENTNAILFPTPSGSWGTVTDVGIFDAASAGNGLFFSACDASFAPGSGDTVQFAAGALDVVVS